jgi:hypothetical protein
MIRDRQASEMTRAAGFCQTSFSVFTLSSPECSNEIKDGGKGVSTALSCPPALWRKSPKLEGRNPKEMRNRSRSATSARETVWISDFGLRIYAASAISIFVQSDLAGALHNFVFRLALQQLYWGRD